MTDKPAFTGAQRYRVTADDYARMIDGGAFGDAHVELIDGELIEMSPSNSEHGRLMALITRHLGNAYEGTGVVIYNDINTQFDNGNARAPDIAAVDTDIGKRKHLVPADILLAVEVAGSTLEFDLGEKRADYAAAGIRNYWVMDVEGQRTHCFADPQGTDYATLVEVPFGQAMAVPGVMETMTIA